MVGRVCGKGGKDSVAMPRTEQISPSSDDHIIRQETLHV